MITEPNIWKSIALEKAPEIPFWGLDICVNFDIRESKKIENIDKLNKIIIHNKNIDIHKTA